MKRPDCPCMVWSTRFTGTKRFPIPTKRVRLEGLEGLKTAIRDSKAFGGTSVLLVPGVCNKDVTYEQAWERSIPLIKQALPLAEEQGIDILFENV